MREVFGIQFAAVILSPFAFILSPFPMSLDSVWTTLHSWTEEGRWPAAGAVVGSSQKVEEARLFGRQHVAADSPP
ncbi:MAG: hypothetical protein AB7O62_14710, partial [Pirellulales bacterium]